MKLYFEASNFPWAPERYHYAAEQMMLKCSAISTCFSFLSFLRSFNLSPKLAINPP